MHRELALIVVMALMITSAGWAQNLLSNPGFETGDGSTPADPSGWVEYGADSAGQIISAFRHSGLYSAKRWMAGDNQEGGYYQDFTAYPYDQYRCGAYLFSPGGDKLSGSSYACLRIEFFSKTGERLLQVESPRLTTQAIVWTPYSVTATAPAGTTHGRFVFAMGAGASPHSGSAYCDDASAEMLGIESMSDDDFLDLVQHKVFDFFWNECSPIGLIKDRAGNFHPDSYTASSIASTGFGLAAICIGEDRGWVSRSAAHDRIYTTLITFRDRVPNDHGFFYHFMNMNTGQVVPGSELSTIDTALLIFGALYAGEYFEAKYGDSSIKNIAEPLFERIDWPAYYGGSWTYCEYIMMDLLAFGSPTHPIPTNAWNTMGRNYQDAVATRKWDHSYPRIFFPALFVHQYPQCYIDFRFRRDAYTFNWTYYTSSRNNTRSNRQYCIDHSLSDGIANPKYQTYGPDCWGLTAGDGESGYTVYGEAEPALSEPDGTHGLDGTVLPTAPGASVMFAPEICIPALKFMRQTYGSKVWGRYGLAGAFNIDHDWYAPDVIGIDIGAMILSIENYRTGRPWRYFMRNSAIRRGIRLAGFTDYPQASYDDFDNGAPNAWGSSLDSGWDTGSISYIDVDASSGWVGGKARRILASEAGDGAYIWLNGFNACYCDYVGFSVRGESGGEQVKIGLKDSAGREFKVDLSSYLPSGALTRGWQRVSIPLSAFGSVHLPSIDLISFAFDNAPAAIQVDYLAFTGSHPDSMPLSAPNLGAAAELPAGSPVNLSGLITTAGFGNYFYVEEPERFAGIRVNAGAAYIPGDVLSLTGSITMVDGERVFVPASLTKNGRESVPAPLGVAAGALAAGSAPDVTGLRVRTWGVAGAATGDEFTIDDGSHRLLTILAPSMPKPDPGRMVVVTGIVGARSTMGGAQLVLRVRSPYDIYAIAQ